MRLFADRSRQWAQRLLVMALLSVVGFAANLYVATEFDKRHAYEEWETLFGSDPNWYLLKLIKRSGAPMARRHADDMVFYAALGIILGGRLGYVLFYKPGYYLFHPLESFAIWHGGMSFHGGLIGVLLGGWLFARRQGLHPLRVGDAVACATPIGLFFGRLANFINAELWGRVTDVP